MCIFMITLNGDFTFNKLLQCFPVHYSILKWFVLHLTYRAIMLSVKEQLTDTL